LEQRIEFFFYFFLIPAFYACLKRKKTDRYTDAFDVGNRENDVNTNNACKINKPHVDESIICANLIINVYFEYFIHIYIYIFFTFISIL